MISELISYSITDISVFFLIITLFRFNISNYTARTDLKSLVELGFLEIIQVNKQKQNFVKSLSFETTLKKYKL